MLSRMDLDGRRLRSIANSSSGDVDGETVFEYHQHEGVVWATYAGGAVQFGTLIGLVVDDDRLDVRYQHVTRNGELKAGRCDTVVETLDDGRCRLHETWQWTEGGDSAGKSTVEEVSS